MKYQIIHKLTNKPIRELRPPYNVIVFDTKHEAKVVCSLKNQVMKADFYKIVEVKS